MKSEREVATEYTVEAFVSRTIVNDAKQFKPYTATVERVGELLCATVSEEGTVVCPARLAATWETASADVGSNACDVVDVLLYSQAQVQSEIAAEIEAGTFGYSITAETDVDETVVVDFGGGGSLTEVENDVEDAEDAVSAASSISSGFFTAFTAALVALLA
jgi:hypothetical protein